jgi:hypothetical protein
MDVARMLAENGARPNDQQNAYARGELASDLHPSTLVALPPPFSSPRLNARKAF